jgi:hypothetical protein
LNKNFPIFHEFSRSVYPFVPSSPDNCWNPGVNSLN